MSETGTHRGSCKQDVRCIQGGCGCECHGLLPDPTPKAQEQEAEVAEERECVHGRYWKCARAAVAEEKATSFRSQAIRQRERAEEAEERVALLEKARPHRQQLEKAEAEAASLREQLAEALMVLNPVCKEETLVGAIRNLQQAHIGERENAEYVQQRLKVAEELLRCAPVSRRGGAPWWNKVEAHLAKEPKPPSETKA